MKIAKFIMSVALAICVCACEKEISDGGDPIDVQMHKTNRMKYYRSNL